MTNTEIFDKLTNAIVTQNIASCAQLTQEALNAGIPPIDIITKGLSPGMKIVGDKFEAAEIFLPQIMMSGKAMSNAMEILNPELEKTKVEGEETGLAITFVAEGDIHDIGHRLVTTMLGANG
ncbi:monomethylamine corrinoid protein 1, partial [Methanosarcina sp. 2.H.T.1A.6]